MLLRPHLPTAWTPISTSGVGRWTSGASADVGLHEDELAASLARDQAQDLESEELENMMAEQLDNEGTHGLDSDFLFYSRGQVYGVEDEDVLPVTVASRRKVWSTSGT